MSRGRKPNQIIKNDWESIFLNSVGSYVQLINSLLSNSIKLEPLSNYIRIAGGYAFKSSNYSTTGIPVIRISDFNNERIILDNAKYYKEDDALKKYELHQGDIVIALTGGTIAKLGIVQEGIGKLYLNQRVGKFEILDDNIFENEYVYWIARSVQSIIKNLAWGAAIPNVSPKQIEKLKFPIPAKKVQKGIISFLNDLKNNQIKSDVVYFNSKIENQIILMHQNQVDGINISSQLTHQLDLVKQLRQSFLREAMQGRFDFAQQPDANEETGAELLAKIKAEKEQLIKEKKIRKPKPLPPITKEEIPFEIPENWVWCRLGDIVLDQVYGTSSKADVTGDIPVLRMGNITTDGKILYSNLKYVAKSIKDLPKLFLENNDLVFNRTNSFELVGKCGVFNNDEPYTLASYLIRVRFGKNTSSHFISNYINSSLCRETQIEPQIIQQNGQANFNGTKLASIIVPFPPLSEQKRIVAKLDELMAYCDSLEESIKNSQTQNEMLLGQVLREALEPKS